MKLALAAASLLLATACGGAVVNQGAAAPPPVTSTAARVSKLTLAAPEPGDPVEPPASRGVQPLEGFRRAGPERPAGKALRFDVDGLPVASWGEAVRGAGFTLHRTRDGWTLWVSTTILAEVVVATISADRPEGAAHVGFTAFTGGSGFGRGMPPSCGMDRLGTRIAFWSGFAPAGWTASGVDVEMEEGDYDLATCSASPKRSLRGRAAAIVPGYVYGLRVRDEDDAGRTHESLVVFMPRGALVSTASDPTMPLNASNTGPFTRLTFPLEPGTAGSASVRVTPQAVALWTRLHAMRGLVTIDETTAPHDALLLGLDVACQGDVRAGTLSLAPPPGPAAKAYAKLFAAAGLRP